jgi:hypothetical protein
MKKNSASTPKIVTLLVGALLLTLAFLYQESLRSSPHPARIKESLGVTDELSLPSDYHEYRLDAEPATLVFPVTDGNPQLLRFFYYCPSSCPQIWLTLPGHKSQIEYLVYHPVFERYPMHYLNFGDFNLFQQHLRYTDLASLIDTPPKSGLYVDPQLADRFFPNHPVVNVKTGPVTSTPRFIFTTFQPPRMTGYWYEFARYHQLTLEQLSQATLTATLSATSDLPVHIKAP